MVASRRASVPTWVLGLLGALAILVVYARAYHGDFLWDDDAHITQNPTIIGPLGLKEIWTSGKANYFPLTMTSFWVQHALWGLSPGPYHGVSVLFHLAAALLLWRVLVRLQVPGAWLGAMLWALHPVQVESVAWICELKNTQSGFFYLLAIYFFIRWIPRERAEAKISRDYVLALVAAILAILSKSSTVMLPVVLGLVGWWLGKRRWRDALWLWPFFAVSLLASGWTIWEQKVNSMASGPDWGHGLASRFMIAGKVPWFYLGKLVWPHPLVFIYPRWDVNEIGFLHWIPLVATIAVVAGLWRYRERVPPLFLAFTVFGVSIFPVLGLFDVFFFKYSFVGDHFQYLASMGPLVLIGAGVAWLAGRIDRRVQAVAGIALLGVPCLLTYQQTAIYLNREALWSDTVARNPHAWIARMNLGFEYMTTGRPALGIPHFEAALRLRPGDALAETNWGGALIQTGKPAEAIPHLENAIRLMPELAAAHQSLGFAYGAVGRTSDAIARVETALRLQPDSLEAHANLGNLLFQSGRAAEAVPHYLAVARAQPASVTARNNLASALMQSGHLPEAIQLYREALQIDPNYHEARMNLALALGAAGRKNEAIENCQEILRRKPDHAAARAELSRLAPP